MRKIKLAERNLGGTHEPVFWDTTAGVCVACGMLEIANHVGDFGVPIIYGDYFLIEGILRLKDSDILTVVLLHIRRGLPRRRSTPSERRHRGELPVRRDRRSVRSRRCVPAAGWSAAIRQLADHADRALRRGGWRLLRRLAFGRV